MQIGQLPGHFSTAIPALNVPLLGLIMGLQSRFLIGRHAQHPGQFTLYEALFRSHRIPP